MVFAFSADGSLLATAGGDKKVIVWDGGNDFERRHRVRLARGRRVLRRVGRAAAVRGERLSDVHARAGQDGAAMGARCDLEMLPGNLTQDRMALAARH